MTYLISVSYDGSKYDGLQRLKRNRTVQGELETVLTKMNEEFVQVKSAGRTDKGVHAYDQKCQFDINKDTNPYKLRYYLNNATSKYIYIKDCKVIEDNSFHVRHSVKSKTYLYKINVGEYSPIMNDYLYNYCRVIDIKKIKKISKLFLGQHNYKAFVTGKNEKYISEIKKIKIYKRDDILNVEISGKSFYTYMIRNIIKVLLMFNEGIIDELTIKSMLIQGKKLVEYGPVPASGLYLKKVYY